MPMSESLVRPARKDDLSELVRLCAAHAAYEQADFNSGGKESGLERLLFGPSPHLYCVVAESPVPDAKSLVGYATWARQVSTWDADFYAYMDCLYLDPDARGHGLGRILMGHLTRQAVAKGCKLVQWQTPVFNTRAMQFYDRLGARSLKKERYFLDAAAMNRLVDELGTKEGGVTF